MRESFSTIFAALLLPSICLAAEPVDFEKQIRPIFATHCLRCHGVDKQEGGLRLDHRATALRGGDSGSLVTPGKSGESEIYSRVSSADETTRMPPVEEGIKPLSPQQVALIKKWIDAGAKWPDDGSRLVVKSDHWAYQPITTGTIPTVKDEQWSRHEMDRFVLARLESQGVAPSPRADRITLLRRLHYDLIGVPPSPQEVQEFLADSTGDAFQKLVARLLKSPHFGERWGRHWLDKARYADSDGYEKDRPRPNAWRYRDWVIEAVNADLPFDQFTIEQLAGDLLPNAKPMQKLATAFHRQTLTNTEGGTDKEQFRVEAVFDRVATTGAVWLGLTVGCAQCHSHKYDQITQAEYYQMFAFFNNGDETEMQVPISEAAVAKHRVEKAQHDEILKAHQAKINAYKNDLRKSMTKIEDDLQARLKREAAAGIKYHPLEAITATAKSKAKLTAQKDKTLLVTGPVPDTDTYTIVAKTTVKDITAIRLDTPAHKSLPAKGPGRTPHGNFVLSEFRVSVADNAEFKNAQPLKFQSATADHSQNKFPPKNALSNAVKTGWAVAPKFGQSHWIEFLLPKAVNGEGQPRWLKFELLQDYGGSHTIGSLKLSARTGTQPSEQIPENVRQVLAVAKEKRNAKQAQTLLGYAFSTDAKGRVLLAQLEQIQKRAPKSPLMKVRVVSQRMQAPRTTHILRRGDFLQPQAVVEPTTLGVLQPLTSRHKDKPADRLDFARWLVAPSNPLTPRVAVNHVWRHLFGVGLVRTMNDFGVRGEQPTHPQLLDHLAAKYVEFGWSRKKLIGYIVNSATYQQSSRHRPELANLDAENRLLHRQNRFRVEAEIVRDLYLSAAGLLSEKVGGPSVFPPMPADVAALSYANNFKWKTSAGEDRYRRGMYTFFKRTSPYPNLVTFDCPDANTTSVERRNSNTPLMALTTLNNEVYIESSQALAKRLLEDSKDAGDAERIAAAFGRTVSRDPDSGELASFHELLTAARKHYSAHTDDAKKLVGSHQPKGIALDEAAAWVVVARTVLNMDEFITRE